MILDKTKNLVEWLEVNQSDRQYSITDLKELLFIAMTELADHNNKSFESLPGSIVDAIIEDLKANGEYYQLQNMIENFKSKLR